MQFHDPQHQSTNLRWRAITQRDPTAHFSFIYGVKTTRIYCRPTCTARVARRANIVYYETPAEAQRDGYRPCSRCKPDDASFIGQQEEIVTRTLALLRDGASTTKLEGGVKSLARDVGVTPSYLCRVFKKTMGCTLSQYRKNFEELQSISVEAPEFDPSINLFESEVASSARLPEPVHQSDEHTSTQSLSNSFGDILLPPRNNTEESLDSEFDFDEWLWTAELDFSDCTIPNMSSRDLVCE